MMDARDFKSGETIFSYGEPGGEIFILRNGRVELFVEADDGEKIILAENEHGDVIGELSFLDGGHRTATAIAREDTQTLTMHRERLLEFIDKHPHAAMDLLTVVGRRLRITDDLLRTRVSRNVNVEEEERMTGRAHRGQGGFLWRLLDFHYHIRRGHAHLGTDEHHGPAARPL